MLNNEIWELFKITGNIEVYLYYKEYLHSLKEEEGSISDTILADIVGTGSL